MMWKEKKHQGHVFHAFLIAVQLLSRVLLCDPMNCSASGFPVLHYFLEYAQTYVCWVSDAV